MGHITQEKIDASNVRAIIGELIQPCNEQKTSRHKFEKLMGEKVSPH
jgi:hypothetical protein